MRISVPIWWIEYAKCEYLGSKDWVIHPVECYDDVELGQIVACSALVGIVTAITRNCAEGDIQQIKLSSDLGAIASAISMADRFRTGQLDDKAVMAMAKATIEMLELQLASRHR